MQPPLFREPKRMGDEAVERFRQQPTAPAAQSPATPPRSTRTLGTRGQTTPAGAISPDGFFYGTNTKAWSPENDPLGLPSSRKSGGGMGLPGASPMSSPFQQGQQPMMPMLQPPPGQQGQMAPMPGQGQQQPPMGMPSRGGNPMMPPGGFQDPGPEYEQDLRGGRFGQADKGMYRGFTEEAYTKSYEQLEKARQAVAADPRFSPEQRRLAFEKIAARADELDQGFNEGRAILQSPTGYDAPPPEEFADMQGGLEPMQDGRMRNPQTGDILQTTRAPNGQMVPVTADQVEIDALPDGTRYMNPNTGEIEVAGEGAGRGGSRSSSRSGTSAPAPGEPMTQEQAFAAYEKWSKGIDPGSTPEERKILTDVIGGLEDPERQEDLLAMASSDPISAIEALQQDGIDVADQLEEARIAAFAREQKARGDRTAKIAKALGIEQPEQAKPPVDPTKYRTRIGNRGTMVVRRRGSEIDIPAVMGEDGQPRPAPVQARQLADLEVDTEFANIQRLPDGREIRVLPFEKEMVNLENFALTDAQRKALSKETASIRPRRPEEWQKFEGLLQKYQTVNEPWDPKNLTPAQSQLVDAVNSFYSEMQPAARAAMTLYIAHSLGYRVDKNRPFTSTGWASKTEQGLQAGRTASEEAAATGVQDSSYEEMAPSILDKFGTTTQGGGDVDFEDLRTDPSYQQMRDEIVQNVAAQASRMQREFDRDPRAFGKRGFSRFEFEKEAIKKILASDQRFSNSAVGRKVFEDIQMAIHPNTKSAESLGRYQEEFRQERDRSMGDEAVGRYMEETRPMTEEERRASIPDWRERVRRRYEPTERVRKEASPDETRNEAVDKKGAFRDAIGKSSAFGGFGLVEDAVQRQIAGNETSERYGNRRREGEARRVGDEAVERFNESAGKKKQGRKPIADAIGDAWKNRRREPTAEDRYRDRP